MLQSEFWGNISYVTHIKISAVSLLPSRPCYIYSSTGGSSETLWQVTYDRDDRDDLMHVRCHVKTQQRPTDPLSGWRLLWEVVQAVTCRMKFNVNTMWNSRLDVALLEFVYVICCNWVHGQQLSSYSRDPARLLHANCEVIKSKLFNQENIISSLGPTETLFRRDYFFDSKVIHRGLCHKGLSDIISVHCTLVKVGITEEGN